MDKGGFRAIQMMNRFYARCWLLVLVLLGALEWIFVQDDMPANDTMPRLGPGILRLFVVLYMLIIASESCVKIVKQRFSLLVAFWACVLTVSFIGFWAQRSFHPGFVPVFLKDVYWILACWTAIALTERGVLTRNDLALTGAGVVSVTFAMALWYWQQGVLVTGLIDRQRSLDEGIRDFQNAAYQVVAGMLLLYGGGKLRWNWNYVLATACLAGLIVLGKRGAFLAAVIATNIAFLVGWRGGYIRLWKLIFLYSIGLLAAILLVATFQEEVAARLKDLNDPERRGSHRGTLYSILWEDWLESDAGDKVMGKGYQATINITREEMGRAVLAHCDWLEMLVDYGIIGFSWLCLFHVMIARRILQLYMRHSERAASLAIWWVAYLPITIYSFTLTGYTTAWHMIIAGYCFASRAADDCGVAQRRPNVQTALISNDRLTQSCS